MRKVTQYCNALHLKVTYICVPDADRYIYSNRQQYIVWLKIIHFSVMKKIIMLHEDI